MGTAPQILRHRLDQAGLPGISQSDSTTYPGASQRPHIVRGNTLRNVGPSNATPFRQSSVPMYSYLKEEIPMVPLNNIDNEFGFDPDNADLRSPNFNMLIYPRQYGEPHPFSKYQGNSAMPHSAEGFNLISNY